MTRSEILFDSYCQRFGYDARKIPSGSQYGRTSDRDIQFEGSRFIAEIKELTPNKEDKRKIKELQEKGWTHSTDRPGRRLYKTIQKAADQLKRYDHLEVPCVLVVLDNIDIDGQRTRAGSVHLEPAFIDYAMYGLHLVSFSESRIGYSEFVSEYRRGGKRQMTNDHRIYISAICVLAEHLQGESPFIYTYHNYFAKHKLPFSIFSSSLDRHFVKSAHPSNSIQDWLSV